MVVDPMKRVTLNDIAADTGLSKYAVSRAISGKAGVSAETRELILASCKRLGYTKNTARKAGSYILLMIRKTDFDDPAFWMPVIQGVESAASANGYLLHIKLLHSQDDGLATMELANATGIVYAGYRSTAWISEKFNRPSVLMSYPPTNMFPMDCLYCSDIESGSTICRMLIDWGHKRIAYCGNGERASAVHRLQGIRAALAESGMELDSIWKLDDLYDLPGLVEKFRQRRQQGELPTAFLCETEILAGIVQRAAGLLHLSVPEDISIVTFNNEIRSKQPNAFTGMALNKVEYGREAVRMLLERVEGPERPYRRVTVCQTFVDSKSAGICNAGLSEKLAQATT